MSSNSTYAIPVSASSAVLKPSDPVPKNIISVQGPNFDKPLSLHELLGSYERIGFQANSLGKAINIVNRMVSMALCPTHELRHQLTPTAQMAAF